MSAAHSLNLSSKQSQPGEKSLSRSCDRKFTAACSLSLLLSLEWGVYIQQPFIPQIGGLSIEGDPFEIYESREIRGPQDRKSLIHPQGVGKFDR